MKSFSTLFLCVFLRIAILFSNNINLEKEKQTRKEITYNRLMQVGM